MALILDMITVGNQQVYSVDNDPAISGGTQAPVGSLALWDNGTTGRSYVKVGAANTAWEQVNTASAGIVASSSFLNIPIYSTDPTGSALAGTVQQNAQNVNIAISAQPGRTSAITYSVPNPGNAVTAASFVLSEGTQTINGSKTFSSSVDFGGQRALNIADPVAAQDAATKIYVDSIAQGISWKRSARAATTANITLSGAQTIDGVSVIAGDRVLVKNQTLPAQNGIYVAAAGAWTRSTDADAGAEVLAAAIYIDEGSLYADTAWVQTTNAPITIGTTALNFVQFAGAGSYTAGNGLTLSGTQFSVNLAANSGLQFNGSALDTLLDGGTLSKSAAGLRVALLGITNAEISTTAAIARSKIAVGTPNHIVINDGTGALSSEARLALSRTADGTANFVLVAQGAGNNPAYQLVVDANISASAAISLSKLAALTASKLLESNGSGVISASTGTGFVRATAGTPSYQAAISLTADVSGVLPIANGGTNSSTALVNNRIMISSAGAIVVNPALAAGRAIYTDINGLPAVSANFAWDNTASRLSVGGTASTRTLDVSGNAIIRADFRLENPAGTTNLEWTSATANTTDATVATLQTIAIPLNATVWIETTIVARRNGGTGGAAGDAAVYKRTSRFKNVGGTVTQHNLQSDYTSEDVGGYNGTLDFTGTNARVRITGAANTNVSWQCFSQIMTQV